MTERPLSGTEKGIVDYIYRNLGATADEIIAHLKQTDPEWPLIEDPQQPFIHLVLIGYIECIKIPSGVHNEYYLTPQGTRFAAGGF